MTRIVSIDGAIVPPAEAVVSVFDRGFLYGDGVFETLRIYGGRAFAIAEHMDRLARSCGAIRLPMPVALSAVWDELERAVAASGLRDAHARVIVTRGVGDRPSLVPEGPVRPSRVVLVEPWRPLPRAIYAEGLRAVTLGWSRTADGGPASSAKLLSYVASFVALEEARDRGADEALFVGGDGRVRDASTSNVVLVDDHGMIRTPSDGPGVLGGITRGHVLDLACSLGMSVSLDAVNRDDLARAREVFLTSSLREIASVVSIDGHAVGDGLPGPIARSLHRAYRMRCGADGPPPWE